MCGANEAFNDSGIQTEIIPAAAEQSDSLSSPEFHAFEQELDLIFRFTTPEQRTLLTFAAAGLRTQALSLVDQINTVKGGVLQSIGKPGVVANLVIRATEAAIRHATYNSYRIASISH